MRRLLLTLTLVSGGLLVSGCDCEGSIPSQGCTADADCGAGLMCVDEMCVSRPDASAGMDGAVGDDGSMDAATVDAGGCGPTCRAPARCRFGTCVPDLGTCESNEECPGDSYCSAEGECLPYGVPPDVVNDPSCRRREVVEEVSPVVQCEWQTPGDDDPQPDSTRIYTAPIVVDLDLDEDPGRIQPSIIVTTWYDDTSIQPSDATHRRIGMLRVFDGRTCEEQFNFGGREDDDADRNNPHRPGYGTQWAVADLDGDLGSGGRPEIVGLRRATLRGPGGSPENPVPPPLQLYAIKVDVVDGEPVPRLFWVGRDCASGEPLDFANNSANYGPGIWDLDDDGDPEILIGAMVFDHEGCLLNTPEPDDRGPIYVTHGPMHTVADVDGDGRVELITGTRIAHWDSATAEWVDAEWFTPTDTLQVGHVAVADLGQYSEIPGHPIPNDLPEIIVVSAQHFNAGTDSTGTIRVQTLDGRVVFGPIDLYYDPALYGYGGKGGPPTASDFDGDGHVEFAAAAGEFFTVYDPDCDDDPDVSSAERPGGRCDRSPAMAHLPNGVLWAQPSRDRSSNSTGSSVFDFNGDGRAEAVYRDECYLRVYDGASGEVIYSTSASSGTGFEFPVIADVDGDFATEIVVPRTTVGSSVCSATDPLFPGGEAFRQENGFAVYRDPEDRWANSRPIWNQHAYSVTHVTDQGQVVRTRDWRQNWRVDGLNNFRQNVQGDLGYLNIADLTVVFYDVSALCETALPAELELRARVCNRGTNPVGDGVLVHFGENETLVCETETTRFLVPGECEEVSCSGTVTSADDLVVRVDPNDEIVDCRPANNEGVPAARLCLY